MLLVFVIRHGESVGNLENRMGGLTDFPLTKRGIEQARVLARWLTARPAEGDNALYSSCVANVQEVPFSTVYASPLSRARQTAEIFLEELKKVQTKPFQFLIDERIIEVKTGKLDGLPLDQLGEYEDIIRVKPYPLQLQFPGGESIQELVNRTKSFVDEIKVKHLMEAKDLVGSGASHSASTRDAKIAIFSHQLTINYLLHHLLEIPVDGAHRFPVGNAAVTALRLKRHLAQLLLYNCSPAMCWRMKC